MYNRYIPQEDGTYACKSVGEEYGTIALDAKSPGPENTQAPPPQSPMPPSPPPQSPMPPSPPPKLQGIGEFFRQLLPRGVDTVDLLVVLLLLLMAGDSPEDQGNAMLTMGLYLFL